MLEHWLHVCRVKFTCTWLPTNCFVCTKKNSIKSLISWILLRIQVRSINTQPHVEKRLENPLFSRNFVSKEEVRTVGSNTTQKRKKVIMLTKGAKGQQRTDSLVNLVYYYIMHCVSFSCMFVHVSWSSIPTTLIDVAFITRIKPATWPALWPTKPVLHRLGWLKQNSTWVTASGLSSQREVIVQPDTEENETRHGRWNGNLSPEWSKFKILFKRDFEKKPAITIQGRISISILTIILCFIFAGSGCNTRTKRSYYNHENFGVMKKLPTVDHMCPELETVGGHPAQLGKWSISANGSL